MQKLKKRILSIISKNMGFAEYLENSSKEQEYLIELASKAFSPEDYISISAKVIGLMQIEDWIIEEINEKL